MFSLSARGEGIPDLRILLFALPLVVELSRSGKFSVGLCGAAPHQRHLTSSPITLMPP